MGKEVMSVTEAIEFARSNTCSGGPKSIRALHTLADEVTRLREALKGAHAILDIAKEKNVCLDCGQVAPHIEYTYCRCCFSTRFSQVDRVKA